MPFNWEKLLEIAPLLISAQGSPQRAAALQGWMHSQGQIQQGRLQQQKQQQDEAYRRAQLENQQFSLQSQQENMQQDNARADAQLALQRLSAYRHEDQGLLGALDKAPDTVLAPEATPLQAQNDLTVRRLQAQQDYGVPQGTPQGPLPNMTAAISTRKKKKAAELYAQAEKRFGAEAMAGDSITLKTGELFGDIKPSALRALFETPAMDASGQPAAPYVKGAGATPGSFEEYVGAPPERQAVIEAARKRYMQADDAGRATPRDRYNVQPITNPDGTTGLVRVNMETGETSRIALPADAAGAGRPTSTEQISQAYLIRTQASDEIAKSFESQLASLGPQLGVQLPNLLRGEAGQRYRQSQDEFINASLRRESGAAIQPSEYDRFAKIYFVQPGDTAATIAQKQAARERVVRGFKTATGNLGRGASAATGPRFEILETK